MKTLLCLAFASLLAGCLPVGIRGQNLPLASQPATQVSLARPAITP